MKPSLPATASGLPSRCPRCAAEFVCGVNGPGPCPCTSVALSDALQADLRRGYAGCLCLRCLQTLAAEAPEPP